MILKGDEIFKYLANQVTENSDPGESSHWRKYHANFKYTGSGFSGLSGFGGCSPSYKGLRRIAHTILQKPFREIGKQFSSFDEMDTIAAGFTRQQSRAYDLDVLRQVITISMLKKELGYSNENTLVIGDGFASMTSLIHLSNFSTNTILVNLTKTIFVDLWYLREILGDENFGLKVLLVTTENDLENLQNTILKSGESFIIAFEARNQHFIRALSLDLVINIASMQEMDIGIVQKYISDMRHSQDHRHNQPLMFYCCNRVVKKLPGGEITRFDDYGWLPEDTILFDELCPWHQKYYTNRPPFYRPYDGPIKHRLVNLKRIK